MALASVLDAAEIIGCARNSVYHKIRRSELRAVVGPSGFALNLKT